MSEDIVVAMVTGLVVICVTTVLPLALAYMKRSERIRTHQSPVHDLAARLDRLELGMESMSGEIERIGEGQRFTTRLLTERDPRALGSPNAATRSD